MVNRGKVLNSTNSFINSVNTRVSTIEYVLSPSSTSSNYVKSDSSTANAIAVYDDTTGLRIKNSGASIAPESGTLTAPNIITGSLKSIDNTTSINTGLNVIDLVATSVKVNGVDIAGGNGTVSGPVSSIDNAVARFNSTTGEIIQNSGVIINDENDISGVVNLSTTGALSINNLLYTPNQEVGIGVISPTEPNLHSLTIFTGIGVSTYNVPAGTANMDGLCLKFINSVAFAKTIVVTGSTIDGAAGTLTLAYQHDTLTIMYYFNNNTWYTF
jgi:hypothetical protein